MFKHIVLPALAAVTLVSGPVLAQPGPAQPGPTVDGPRVPGSGMRRLEELHRRLGITPAQEPEWQAVLAAVRDNAMRMRQSLPPPGALEGAPAPELVRRSAELARLRADGAQALVQPVETLYASLSPPQRAEADRIAHELFGRGMRRGG